MINDFIKMFGESVRKYPDHTAITDQDRSLKITYEQLDNQARKIAAFIQAQHLPSVSFVVITLPLGTDYLASILGVWMAGHAITPLADHFPAERIAYIKNDCESPLTIDQACFTHALSFEPIDEPLPRQAEDYSVLFYTSGSTGNPKGIIHTVESINFAISTQGKAFGFQQEVVFGCGVPFYFVASLFYLEILQIGATICLYSKEARTDVKCLEEFITQQGITYAFISPGVLSRYNNQKNKLRKVLTGSERVSCVSPGEYEIVNCYGLTESGGPILFFNIDREMDNIPIGAPADNIEAFILDENGNKVPDGEAGEICLKGIFTKGYFKNEEATRRLYRGGVLHTGDLGKKRPDGNLLYLNRNDWMVKINGQRVEPGEIEGIMKKIEGVDNAIVKGFVSNTGSQFLCSYYISKQGVTEQFIKDELCKKIPAYMVPSFFIQMEAFPINQNGKQDRKSLLPPDLASLRSDYAAPENETERQLCKAFAEVLKLDQVGIDDDFIRLGGDSISIMTVQQKCPKLPLTAKIIYKGRTPRKIAEQCNTQRSVSFVVRDDYPLSQTQMGIYIECLNRQGEAVYNNPCLYRFEEDVDISRLASAIEAVTEAHPFIKTRIFTDKNGTPRQRRNEGYKYTQSIEHISEADLSRIQETLIQPFDLLSDELFRIRLFKTEKATYLFLDFHHVIYDGSSHGILIKDINAAYRGDTLTTEQWSSFEIAGQEEVLRETEAYTDAETWYKKTFGGLDTDSQPLPDRNLSEMRFGEVSRTIALTHDQLEMFSRQKGVTPNILTSAAFGYLLGSYTNSSDALFATIYNGRTDICTATTVGMLVKTLPVYCRWQDDTPVAEFLIGIKEQMMGSMTHDIYSFAELSARHSLTSKILFAYQGDLHFDATLCGVPYREIKLAKNATGEILTVQVFHKNNALVIQAEYHENLYSPEYIERLLGCYETILNGFIHQPMLREVALVPKIQEEELDSFNPEEVSYDKTASMITLLRQQAALTPENIAVIYKEKQITYHEVDEISDRIARYINKKEIGKGDVVSILIHRGEFMPIASIGVLKAGCAYQPLDPTYPAERLNFMMQDSTAKLLIADRDLWEIVSEYTGDILYIDEIPSLPDTGEPLTEVSPEDLFILLYTSGSTGLPKGCRISHNNLVTFCHWYNKFYGVSETSCIGAYASYGFDANMMDTYPALVRGAKVCIIDEDIRLDLVALNDCLETNHVTHMFVTTQVGRQFALNVDNHSLECLSIGGEKLVPLDPPQGYRFYNLYGPTECTILTTAYQVTRREEEIPIGTPLDNFKLYIVDKIGRRLPVGAAGELWIAGPQVSCGYLNRPEQTAYAYIENHFCNEPDYSRIYRSGDIVRYRIDGNIEFVGRRDSQVKIRGFRIELTEVEGIIREFEGIKDATVVAYDDPNGGKFIAAYIVSDQQIDILQLNAFIESCKPPYMVPAVTMQIEAIPLNQNMKVNKRALPKPEIQVSATEASDDNRPLNILEEQIKKIVAEVVNTDQFGVTTKLAYMGLTSISSIKLSAALYKRFEVTIPSKTLAKKGSVELIENEILKHWMEPKNEKSTPAEASLKNRQNTYALSYSQLGVYYDCMKHPMDVVYNIPALLSFDLSIDPHTIAAGVKEIISAHPYVMTHFEMEGEHIVQVRETHDVSVPVENMSEADLEQYKQSFVRPFNLSNAPLYRTTIVKTERRICLLLDFHHLIFDGASLDIFFGALKQKLEKHHIESEVYSYFDYVADEQASESTQKYQDARDYFARQLQFFENASEITSDLKGNPESGILEEVIYALNGDLIEKYCKDHQVTPAALCLSGAFYTISRYVNSKQVYISTISNGRSDIRTSNTFGMFVKTLPLAATIGNQSVREFIAQSSNILNDTIEHENYPFAKIAADYGFTPEIVYACQLGVLDKWTLLGKEVKLEGLELKLAKFKLSIHIEERDGKPSIVLQYNNALYSHTLMNQFATSMGTAIHNMACTPDTLIKKVSMLDKSEWEKLQHFHEVGSATIETKLFHHALEKHALERPNHKALIAVDGDFTYEELNSEANRIAHSLLSLGVTARSRIALLLPRTSRLIMSMFGVMKAGSAYIPCDPEYPIDRINHILKDSEALYVITTSDRVPSFAPGKAIDIEKLLQSDSTENLETDITGEDLAYLIYTSGSTGKPKGVMLQHAGICNYLTDHPVNQHVHAMVTDGHTTLSVTTVSFDMSLKEIGTTLFNGLTLVFASEDEANNPLLLTELFKRTGADIFNATPSRMLQYMELPDFCTALSNCKVIMCGGEKYTDNLLERLQKLTSAHIFNTYGPTEITVSSNCKELTHASEISIGLPLLNYKEYIVDVDGNELPVGVVGELYIGGVGVARGYNNLEEMTREKFIDYNGMRIYKSGDYARWTPQGDVVILGRTDNQVKLRGLRIELGEVEAAIAKIDTIKTAVVVIRKIHKSEHLCAYFTAEQIVDIEQLKEELKKTLTPYMIPTAYLQLDNMPLTPNGKTDLKALPEPQVAFSGHGEAAADKTEQSFCDIFGKILSMENIGATDNFFDLGGTSLVVARVIIEANNSGYQISYGDVFSHPTPRALASLFKTGQESAEVSKEITDYDYSSLKQVLQANNLDNFRQGKQEELGDILLTGATGYLGIHILKEFLDNYTGKVYCLLRNKGKIPAQTNLQSVLFYYFEHSYENLFGTRIITIDGDVTRSESFDILKDKGISTVINCAANVKHFSEGTDIEDVNIGGAKNLIDFCLGTGTRMIHVSTMSVSGMSVNGYPKPGTRMTEQMLYFGQFMDNKYINSKFLAERMILESISEQGLNAKIMRVGNLSARNSDGEFQLNYSTNSFMGRLKSYKILGKCSFDQLDSPLEFSPIDEVAKAILLLSQTPKECCIFHPYNHHFILLGDIFTEMKHIGFDVATVEPEQFNEALAEAEKDPQKAKVLASMIAYRNMAHGQSAVGNVKENSYTMQVLYRMGYRWPVTSWDYVTRFLNSLQGLGFFDY